MASRLVRAALAGAMLALALAAPLRAQAPQPPPAAPDVSGKWQTSLEMEVGTATVTLVFKQEGDTLVGTYTGRYGEYPLAGKITDGKLAFVVTINAEGTITEMHFEGQVTNTPQGVVLRGTADLGGMGEAGWIARKAQTVLQ